MLTELYTNGTALTELTSAFSVISESQQRVDSVIALCLVVKQLS